MKKTINIFSFGPIKKATINVDTRYQVYIGEQASGKSTLCKVVYFVLKIRDHTLDYLMDSANFLENHKNEYYVNYLKYLRKQFMGCFGTTKHMNKFIIEYLLNNDKIEICLDNDGFVRFDMSINIVEELKRLFSEVSEMFFTDKSSSDTLIDSVTKIGVMKKHLLKRLSILFDVESEIIYVPAGRSILATMSEQFQDVSVSELDLTMQDFINLIRSTKNRFGLRIPEMVKNYTKTVNGQINNNAVEQAYQLISSILKADYASESDGEKIYFYHSRWVKLMYSSSGQQEALWILMLVFSIILEKKNSFIIIEEPEAHLFPIAQRHIIELISLMVNVTESKVIITTHSPYILSSANLLLYSEKIEGTHSKESMNIIPKNYRIAYSTFGAFKVGGDSENDTDIISITDDETHMIDLDYIDRISQVNNEDLDKLMSMEIKR